MLEAVTFDFWNTLMWEEPGSLRARRLELWPVMLEAEGISVESIALEEAHDAGHLAYEEAWRAGRQFTVEDAAALVANRLDGLPVDAQATLVEGYCEAGRRAAVHKCDGVETCLAELKRAGVRLGIICDIGLTPSHVVRELLDGEELLELFDGTSFSDQVGHYKPDPAIFEHALASVGGVKPEHAAHVGDRRRTDVAGAQGMGMTAVRYRRVYDETNGGPEAEHVVDDLVAIPGLLAAGARA